MRRGCSGERDSFKGTLREFLDQASPDVFALLDRIHGPFIEDPEVTLAMSHRVIAMMAERYGVESADFRAVVTQSDYGWDLTVIYAAEAGIDLGDVTCDRDAARSYNGIESQYGVHNFEIGNRVLDARKGSTYDVYKALVERMLDEGVQIDQRHVRLGKNVVVKTVLTGVGISTGQAVVARTEKSSGDPYTTACLPSRDGIGNYFRPAIRIATSLADGCPWDQQELNK